MKRKLHITIACLFLCGGTFAILYKTSPLSAGIYRGTFTRNFTTDNPKQVFVLDAVVNSYYLAGVSSNNIYFGNYTSPFHILITDQRLADTAHLNIKIKLDSLKTPRAFRLKVDTPYFYLTNGQMPVYLRGRIGEWTAETYLGDSADFFTESIPTSPEAIVLKSISRKTGEYELARKSKTHSLFFNYTLLQKQIDGLFCLDGKLLYDKKTKKIIYVHTYKNEIIVADSTLQLVARFHTIDTFSRARIRVKQISGTNESRISSPPIRTNIWASVYNNLLFVQSNLLSKNEDEGVFLANSVIDVYDLSDNRYLTSFYIPKYKGKKINSFFIYKDDVIVTANNYIIKYKLPKIGKGLALIDPLTTKNISREESGPSLKPEKK